MFYEELYTELGKLFHHIAAADGKVQIEERETLQELIRTKWKPLEDSEDEYGTDLANLIDFSFEYEESLPEEENGLQSFKEFYKIYKDRFTADMSEKILETAGEIANAYRGKNREERAVLTDLQSLLEK